MSDLNGNGSQDLPTVQSGDTEFVAPDDALYLHIQGIAEKLVRWYEFIVCGDPEEVEKFAKKHRWTANARLKIAPIAIRTIVPAKKKIELVPVGAQKRPAPGELVRLGVTVERLKELAGMNEDN